MKRRALKILGFYGGTSYFFLKNPHILHPNENTKNRRLKLVDQQEVDKDGRT